jgi:phenylacetate-CoA ligase
LHIWEDHFYPEVIDPDTGEQLEQGEEGELVLTALTRETLPILRYRTGDLTSIRYDNCECGRTTVQMDNVTGRADDLLVIRGINFYPTELEDVVVGIDGVAPHYRVDVYREESLDSLELTLELEQNRSKAKEKEELRDELIERLSSVFSFTPDDITLVAPQTLERTEVGKAQYVYDQRE